MTDVRVLERRRFPPLLRAIYDPPPRLYLRGAAEDDALARQTVAVVGARSCSPYGAHVARRLGRELAAAGLVVVSGLARGIVRDRHDLAFDLLVPVAARRVVGGRLHGTTPRGCRLECLLQRSA